MKHRIVVSDLLKTIFCIGVALAACSPAPLSSPTPTTTPPPASTPTAAPGLTATPYPPETLLPSLTVTQPSPLTPSPTASRLSTRTPKPTGTATLPPRRTRTPASTQVAQFTGRNLSLQSPQFNGEDVRLLQERLLALSYTEISVADGWFGPLTDQGVRHFQENNGLLVDGIVGSITWKRLFSTSALPASVTRTPSPTPAARYPRADGSTSTLPLQTLMAAKLFGADYEWRDGFDERFIYVDPDTVPGWPDLTHNGTNKAYLRLIQGKTDFILVAREPSADELTAAQALGVSLEVVPVALDAFVFIINWKNPVTSLTVEQLRSIYSGQIKDWGEVGGPAGLITPYQRDRNSGSQELMDKLVMQGVPMVDAPDMLLYDMFGPFNMIREDLGGLGYSVYYYAVNIGSHPQVKLLSVQGVRPTSATISQRTYPLLCEVYVVVRAGTAPDEPAIQLRDWLLTSAGQAVVAESGYVPIR
jgi:phosphate transport system substrate-binding protein